jgi:hypothetical protein
MTTANQEIVKISYAMLSGQYGGQLIFPSDWVRADLASTILEMPSEADLVTPTLGQKYPIGTQLRKNGSLYRYCKAGETMSAPTGFLKINLLPTPGISSTGGDDGTALYTDAAAGDTALDLANTNSRAKNFYEGAYLIMANDTAGVRDRYTIIASDLYASAAHVTIYIAPPGLKRAHTTSNTNCGITLNPYGSVGSGLAHDCTWHSAIGMARFPITSGYYFWLQTAGFCNGTGWSTWPGCTASYREVYAMTDGSLRSYAAGYQRVGYLLPYTASDNGATNMMMQLDQ